MKIGICLAGGGIKGAAHIGVLQALEEEKIQINCISGTSSGSIVAALYSMGYTPKEILEMFREYGKEIGKIDWLIILKLIFGILFKRKLCIQGLNNRNKICKLINQKAKLKKINLISDIKIPLIIPSVNLMDGSIYNFSSLNTKRSYSDDEKNISNVEIGKVVQASCAYPGVFYPTDINGKKFVDGGVRENIPWKELKNIGAEKIISISFNEIRKEKNKINILDNIINSMNIMMHELYNYEIEGIDFLLEIQTEDIGLLEFNKIDELYNIGYNTTKNNIKQILNYLYK